MTDGVGKIEVGKLSIEHLGAVVQDVEGNFAMVTREFTADLVRDAEKSYSQFPDGGLDYSYHYENIKWGDPYYKPFKDEFNSNEMVVIIGHAAEEGGQVRTLA